jgi:hypothetical protein
VDGVGFWRDLDRLIGRVSVGLTATWAVITEPDRFAAHARDGIAPLLDWSPTEDTGDVRAPWGVLECLEVDLYASAELVDRWAKADGSPLLLIGVFDSDGADVVAYGSTGMVRTFIDLEGYASSIFPGYAPFDDEGNMLEGAAREELEKESELEFNRVCTILRDHSSTATIAAAALRDWALESGLTVEPVERIKELLGRRDVFVEDTVRALLAALGVQES